MRLYHTPGPWISTKAGPVMAGYSQGDAIASLDHNTLIAGCFSDVKGGPLTAEANAKLISAAPDLLEAAEGLLEIGKRDLSNPKYDEYFDALREAVRKAVRS